MGMIAKNVKTDINVIALVGERGREVLEFVLPYLCNFHNLTLWFFEVFHILICYFNIICQKKKEASATFLCKIPFAANILSISPHFDIFLHFKSQCFFPFSTNFIRNLQNACSFCHLQIPRFYPQNCG